METAFVHGLVGAVIGCAGTLIVGYLQNKLGGHRLFAETVSRERMEWIKAFRDEIAAMLAHAEMLKRHPCKKQDAGRLIPYCKARARLLSRMNLTENLHIALVGLVMKLDKFAGVECKGDTGDPDFWNLRETILETTRRILKPEWERVKEEAKGKRK
jgi:hypothetical protein